MKVIVPGDKKCRKYLYFKCNICGCIAKADKSEYIYRSSLYAHRSMYIAECPNCFNTMCDIIDEKEINAIQALEECQDNKS